MNDSEGLTREQIADWVATVEPAESTIAREAPQVTEAAVATTRAW